MVHTPIHSLQPTRVVQERHGHLVMKGTLFVIGVSIGWKAGQLEQRGKISEARVTGDAEHGRIKLVTNTIDPVEKGRQFHLPDMNLETGPRKLRLHQLLQCRLAGADGEKLEGRAWDTGRGS